MDTIVEYKVDPTSQTSTDVAQPNNMENNGRNPDGTFAEGHAPSSPGRPKRKTITELIHEKLDSGTADLTWDQLITIFISMAKRKDRDILKELWHYTDGMPKQKTELSTLDGEPLVVIKNGSTPIEVAK
jgi:hypothetical protein